MALNMNPFMNLLLNNAIVGLRKIAAAIATPILLLLLGFGKADAAPKKPCTGCTLTGPLSLTVGTTGTYTLGGTCLSATSWSINCSQAINSSSGTSATVFAENTVCESATLTAFNGTTTIATKVIIINPAPALVGGTISNPTQTINYNTIPAQINASVATGGGCSGYSYQWKSSADNITFTNITGATGQNYQPGALTIITYFQRQTACSGVTALTTNNATVTVYPQLLGGAIGPSTQNINYNTAPTGLSLTGVSGGNGTYSYQWQSSPSNTFSSPTNVGTNSTSYLPPALVATTYYRVSVNSNGSFPSYSSTAVITVYPQLVSGVATGSQTINYNTVPSGLSESGTSGGTGTYTYQWQSCATIGGTYTAIGGATSSSYTPGALISTIYYEIVTTSNGVSVTSNAVTITVYPQLISGTISPSSQTINYNTTAASLSVTAATGGNGTYTYTWWASPTSGGGYSQVGTGTSFSPGLLTATTYYEVISTSNGATVTTAPVVVNVNPQVFAGIITPSNITVASGTSPGILTATPASGGGCGGSFTYQWQSSPDNVTWTNISGATTLNYSPGNMTSGLYYHVTVTCGTDVEYTIYSKITIGAIATNLNYIRERTLAKAGVTDTVTADGLISPIDVQQTTQYFNGLGRPIQTVAKEASPLQNDMVTMNFYDPLGRESTKYMPYTSPSTTGNFKADPFSEQNTFNTNQFSGEQYYYSQTAYEPSPLNRPSVSFAPGLSWVGGNRGVNIQYLINTVADSVRIWVISSVPGSIPTTSATYAAGELNKNLTADEAGHQVVEYQDQQGKVILKKVQLSSTPGSAHVGWLNTYYIYDDLDNLRFVIQPRAVELINGSWTISTPIANELCFRFEYDYRKRMIIKKIPGAGESWTVFDGRDRDVMAQDSLLRAQQKWLFTRYDSENRPDSTGLITDPTNYTNLVYHETQAATSSNYPVIGSYTNELLTQSYYDDYSWVGGTGTSLGSSMATNYSTNVNYFITSYNASPAYAVQLIPFTITRGLPTGTKTKVIGTANQFLYSVDFYDDRGRITQNQSLNYTVGIDTVTTQYQFSGKTLRILLNHQKNGNTTQHHNVLTKIDYDAALRIRHIYKNIDAAASDQLIDSIQYDELGRLRAKYLGNKMDSIVYNYNVRGWVSGINRNYIGGTANHYFGMELGYDKSTSIAGVTNYVNPEFNGNIGGIIWKSAGDGIGRKYDFSYDNVNRLTASDFNQNSGSAFDKSAGIDFSVSNLAYDANGNILSMNQNGFKVGGSGAIDQLSYSYQTNSNKLSQVTDAANDQNSKLGDFHFNPTNKGSTDYNYDGNGNLKIDNNKAIDTISYNYLNLPQLVHINGKGNIAYTYDAGGNKLKKMTTDSTIRHSTTTLYLDGLIYQQIDTITSPDAGIDTLQFMAHEEGRARWAFHKYLSGAIGYGWEYDFTEKDLLENTRILLTQERDTAQYLATMESAYRATENQLFYNIPASSYPRATIFGYPTDNTTVPNDSVARLNGNGQKVGPAIILKVMFGDTVDIAAKSYYVSQTGTGTNPSLTDVLNSLATGIANMTSGAKGTFSQLNSTSGPLYAALNSFITNKDGTVAGQPRAYLNWILLDNQFNYVSSYPQSGAIPVSNFTMGTLGTPSYSGISITKSGYLYIYVSNETQGWDVFFDNLSVRQRSGPLLEETHYYPFGLTMAAISDKAIKSCYYENRNKFNGGNEIQNKEFADGNGLETYDGNYRMYDPQIGRFWQADPMAEFNEYQSQYSYANNNPILLNDVLGLLSDSTHPQDLAAAYVTAVKKHKQDGPDVAKQAGPAPTKAPSIMKEKLTHARRDANIKLFGVDVDDPIYKLSHTIVDKPTRWETFTNNVGYLGRNVFGDKVFMTVHMGNPADAVSGPEGLEEEGATLFESISKRIRSKSTINFFIGITSGRFEANLAKLAGKAWELSGDGKVKTLIYNGIKYVSRASGAEGGTIDLYRGEELLQKYRLTP
jgi:RHS repeat-associated protein